MIKDEDIVNSLKVVIWFADGCDVSSAVGIIGDYKITYQNKSRMVFEIEMVNDGHDTDFVIYSSTINSLVKDKVVYFTLTDTIKAIITSLC